jgi:hypothetical protein
MRFAMIAVVAALALSACSTGTNGGWVSPYKLTGHASVMENSLVGAEVGAGIIPNPDYKPEPAPAPVAEPAKTYVVEK